MHLFDNSAFDYSPGNRPTPVPPAPLHPRPFPAACGAASFIVAHAAGLISSGAVVPHKVDIGKHVITETGADYYAVNKKGNVPALVLEDGTVLNEGAATLQWLADQNAGAKLAPANGTTARYVLINTLNYLASEVHASYGPLFGPGTDEFKAAQRTKLASKFKFVEENILAGKKFLGGDDFDVASSYLYVMTGWAQFVGFADQLKEFKVIGEFAARVAALPAVVEAHAAMNAAP
jgi:glutathione S-transferase